MLKPSEYIAKFSEHRDIHSLENVLSSYIHQDNGFCEKYLRLKISKNKSDNLNYEYFYNDPIGKEILDEYVFEVKLAADTLAKWGKLI